MKTSAICRSGSITRRTAQAKSKTELQIHSLSIDDIFKRVLEALSCIRQELGSLPHVRKIAYSPKGQLLTVWTFVDDHSEETLREIYKKELEIASAFEDLMLDFTVIFDPNADVPANFVVDLIK